MYMIIGKWNVVICVYVDVCSSLQDRRKRRGSRGGGTWTPATCDEARRLHTLRSTRFDPDCVGDAENESGTVDTLQNSTAGEDGNHEQLLRSFWQALLPWATFKRVGDEWKSIGFCCKGGSHDWNLLLLWFQLYLNTKTHEITRHMQFESEVSEQMIGQWWESCLAIDICERLPLDFQGLSWFNMRSARGILKIYQIARPFMFALFMQWHVTQTVALRAWTGPPTIVCLPLQSS